MSPRPARRPRPDSRSRSRPLPRTPTWDTPAIGCSVTATVRGVNRGLVTAFSAAEALATLCCADTTTARGWAPETE